MADEEYSLLAPFLQKYIYDHRWQDLRPIQKSAIKIILKRDYHLLLASGTASGKTEAAFFPVLTDLYNNPSATVGVLYVGPLKALINDQFERVSDLLRLSEISVHHWHGDVSASEKRKVFEHPSGILQITPESLESILMKHPADVGGIFGDLRYVIIDEVHTFMGQERGSQLLCHLKRIEQLAKCSPRRIGLSATINNYHDAMLWLKSGTVRQVAKAVSEEPRQKEHTVEYFALPKIDRQNLPEVLPDEWQDYFKKIYSEVNNTNAIIFTNNRFDAEYVISQMKEIAKFRKDREDLFYVHHGSLAKVMKEEAEAALRDKYSKCVSSATTTLELGIDIGDLEKVLQIGAPSTCSSYVQRLGRSGRRGNMSKMQFFCPEELDEDVELPERIPWDLLRIVAVIELYDKEGWVEPFEMAKKPFNLLYQQTMSCLYAKGGMRKSKLMKSVLSLPPFENIVKSEYEVFLEHLITIDHLEVTEEGLYRIGLKAEKMVNFYPFLAVFEEKTDFTVLSDGKEIAKMYSVPVEESIITLGGKAWFVKQVDPVKKTITVIPTGLKSKILPWSGDMGNIHSRVVKKMREILLCDDVYPYLSAGAMARLREGREFARKYGFCSNLVVSNGVVLYVFPWVGSLELETLRREILFKLVPGGGLKMGAPGMFYLCLYGSWSASQLEAALYDLRAHKCDPFELVGGTEEPVNGKFEYYVARELRVSEFAVDKIRQDFVYL